MNKSEKLISEVRERTGYTGPLTFIAEAIVDWKKDLGLRIEPCTTRLTTKRCPAFKRSCFKKAMLVLKPGDGPRWSRRAAAWKVAKKQAEERRANLRVQVS